MLGRDFAVTTTPTEGVMMPDASRDAAGIESGWAPTLPEKPVGRRVVLQIPPWERQSPSLLPRRVLPRKGLLEKNKYLKLLRSRRDETCVTTRDKNNRSLTPLRPN